MSTDQNKQRSEADAKLEQEIRQERKFNLAEAIGRMAGPGAMKGVSPIPRLEQAAAEIQEYLDRHLTDTAGVLSGVLLRQVRESDVLLNSFEHPQAALASYVEHILGSEYVLTELVREADMEWGRTFDERPYFEKDGSPPAPNDPYTHESVRAALKQLLAGLTTAPAAK